MKVPLHLQPNDQSAFACASRLALWAKMMRANPNGFRRAPKNKLGPLEKYLNGLAFVARYGTMSDEEAALDF